MTASSGNNAAGQSYSQDCSICLNSIAVCLSRRHPPPSPYIGALLTCPAP